MPPPSSRSSQPETGSSTSSVLIGWQLTELNTKDAKSYEVIIENSQDRFFYQIPARSSNNSFTVNGLLSGARYDVTVHPINLDNIATPNSPKKSFITALKKPARIKIKAHPTTSGVTKISWARVNANVDSYKIIVNQTQEESKPDANGKTRVLQNSVYRLPSNSTQIDIKGLKPETVYQVKIIAELRKKDNSILSVSEPSKTQFLAPPKTPFGVGLFSVGTNTITIFWNLYFYYMYGENTETFILLKQRSNGYRENQVLEIPFDWNGKKAFNVTGLASCESYELTVVAKTLVAGGFQAESTGAKLFATTQPPPITQRFEIWVSI